MLNIVAILLNAGVAIGGVSVMGKALSMGNWQSAYYGLLATIIGLVSLVAVIECEIRNWNK